MALSISNKHPAQQAMEYELLELREFERVTDEAAAVRSVFGSPRKSGPESAESTLPLVIIGYDRDKITQYLSRQRSSTELAIRPICVIGVDDAAPSLLIDHLADSILSPRPTRQQLLEAKMTLAALQEQLERLPLTPEDRPLTLLQYLHSRGMTLKPAVDANARLAYRYPLAECVLSMNTLDAREILDDMGRHSLLTVSHVDRIFTCPDCGHYRVTAKELCPECGSTDLLSQDSIHHFRCGYIAPEAEFRTAGVPVCPKCNGALQHIGVEYNRPGHLVTCGHCNFWATEPLLEAWCAICNRVHPPEKLEIVTIQAYALTANATHIARNGSWNPSSEQPAQRRAVPRRKKAFQTLPDEDRQRSTNYTQALSSVVMKIAEEQGHPITIYNAQVADLTADVDEVDTEIAIDSAKRAIKDIARDSLLCIEAQNNELLIVLHDSDEHRTPTCRQIEKTVKKATGLHLELIEISGDDGVSRAG